jgi:hypothetical protein
MEEETRLMRKSNKGIMNTSAAGAWESFLNGNHNSALTVPSFQILNIFIPNVKIPLHFFG